MADLREQARQAFAIGWTMSGGPMTKRVHMGCQVAVEMAAESPQDFASVIETTLRLGSLEGTWAAIYTRRERLYAEHINAVADAFRALAATVDLGTGIRAYRRTLGMTEAAPLDPSRQGELRAAATAEAITLVHQMFDDPSTPEYRGAVEAVANALLAAQAEGVAGGVAIIAEQTGHVGIDFDLVFTDAHRELARLGEHWDSAQGWLGNVVNGSATDLGNALARVAQDGGDFHAMRDAASDVLTGTDITAVDALIDLAMGQSFSRGALALYARQGVAQVDFLTAGGSRVCPICLRAEAGNPWDIGTAPQPAQHPYCRCVCVPSAGSIMAMGADLARYLVGAA